MTGPSPSNDAWSGISVGYSVVSYLLGGILVGWGIGAALDHFLHTGKVFVAVFMVIGVALGNYLVYLHYGKVHEDHA